MFKRFSMVLLVLVLGVLLNPAPVNSAVRAYTEGVYFLNTTGGPNHSERLEITATKMVEGRWRQTIVHFYCHESFRNYTTRHIDTTAVLVGDPDLLDVSRDLGWGGLQGSITVYDTISGTYHTIHFNSWLPASESNYTYDPATGYFNRNAALEGNVIMDGEIFRDFSRTWMSSEVAHNFSDQWPGY